MGARAVDDALSGMKRSLLPSAEFNSCVSVVCLRAAGGLLPENTPDDKSYKTLDTTGAAVMTVIKALLHRTAHFAVLESH